MEDWSLFPLSLLCHWLVQQLQQARGTWTDLGSGPCGWWVLCAVQEGREAPTRGGAGGADQECLSPPPIACPVKLS